MIDNNLLDIWLNIKFMTINDLSHGCTVQQYTWRCWSPLTLLRPINDIFMLYLPRELYCIFTLEATVHISMRRGQFSTKPQMIKMGRRRFFLLPLLSLLLPLAAALPLRTDSRRIVEESGGNRVKLACVNWVAHLDAVVAEGLSRQPLDAISKRIVSLGFNCVRLTWPLFLATNETLANLTVRQSFANLHLHDPIVGFQANNPNFLDLSLMNAFKTVVSNLGENRVMVILDNHISQPKWCCSLNDSNGFFGDTYFNPDVWVTGLTRMATLFKGTPNVVGMSLRNELRGPKQNIPTWYRYMQKGAEAVHSANPNVLVILSGLYFDTDLSFLDKQPVKLTFTGKLVFEMHWYGFTDGAAWANGNPNQVCGNVGGDVKRRGGFLVERGFPLFVSEFGGDQRGGNVNDNRYLNCFFSVAAELDLDWAVWSLVGSYYYREGIAGMEEFYGMLDANWSEVRNASYLKRISSIQSPFQGPVRSQTKQHKVIFHPLSGQCVKRDSIFGPLKLRPCSSSESWSYTPQKRLTIRGTYFCLQAADSIGKPVKLGIICSSPASKWDTISDSKMHLSSTLPNGTQVCLDVVGPDNVLVTASCKCLSRDNSCDPASQWFKIVNSTRSPQKESPSLKINKLLDFNWRELLWKSLMSFA